MKIKRERQVRLDELLKYVWDNGIENKKYIGTNEFNIHFDIHFDEDGDLDVNGMSFLSKKNTFTITEEVEIDEDTKLNLAEIYTQNGNILEVEFYRNTSVNELLEINEDLAYDAQFIQLLNPDGSIGELIWSKERGLVD